MAGGDVEDDEGGRGGRRGIEYEGHEAWRRREGLLLTEGRDGRERGQTNATLLGQIQSESNGFAARQKRKARCASGGLSFLDRPVIIYARSLRGPPNRQSHMDRIEFAASHRLSRNRPAMDPVRPSDRTSPSKSGRTPRHFPLRMPYATPFLLTNRPDACERGWGERERQERQKRQARQERP